MLMTILECYMYVWTVLLAQPQAVTYRYNQLDWLVFYANFNILGHIVAVSFIGGGDLRPSASNWRTQHAYTYTHK